MSAKSQAIDPKKQPTKSLADKPNATSDFLEKVRDEKHRIASELPSVQQLSEIAARLDAGRAYASNTFQPLAVAALSLWEECNRLLHQQVTARAIDGMAKKHEEDALERFGATKFPVSLDVFLRKVVSGKLESDHMERFRDFLRWCIRAEKSNSRPSQTLYAQDQAWHSTPETTLEEVNERLEQHRKDGFYEGTLIRMVGEFEGWDIRRGAEERKKKAIRGGEATKIRNAENKAKKTSGTNQPKKR